MKKFILTIAAAIYLTIGFAQTPQAFSFQSLVLDDNGAPIKEQMIGVQIQILDGAVSGSVLYSENHRPTTNNNGLYSIEIGRGENVSGSFEGIDWLSGDKYVALSHDLTGGSDYQLVGSSQLLSVPYALASGTSYIAPKIYASVRNLRTTTIDINEPQSKEPVSYHYDWIQGNPEDVFLEYNNLPNNIHITHRILTGYQDNFSAVDTILDGMIRPNTNFAVTDESIALTPGTYQVEMIFRTAENEVLATLDYPLELTDPSINEKDCAGEYQGEKFVTTACDTLMQLIGTNINVIRVDNKNAIVENFLNSGKDIELSFPTEECTEIRTSVIPFINFGQLIVEDLEVMGQNGKLEFFMELNDDNGEQIPCEIIYE